MAKEYVIKSLLRILAFECECNKSSHVRLFLYYENCKCRKRLIVKLVEKYIENIDEEELHQNKIIYNSALNDYEKICSSCKRCSCTLYIVLFAIFFIICISISSFFF